MIWIIIIVLILVRALVLQRYFPKVFWGIVAAGAVAGVIIAVAMDNWWIVLYGCGTGLFIGLVVELICGLIEKRRFERRFSK